MAIKYLKNSKLSDQTILLRCDLNCPVGPGGVSDDFRIRESLPTITLLHGQGNKVLIVGHLGRPKGNWDQKFSYEPVARRLAELLGMKYVATDKEAGDYGGSLVFYTGDIRQEVHRNRIKSIAKNNIVLLENIRFYKEEEEKDPMFAKLLASLADAYVSDGFGVVHHAAVSVTEAAKLLPAYAGLLLEKEIKSLDAVLRNNRPPFVLMTGGIKLSEKVGVLENLGNRADKILVGGGVANLMFLAKGYEIGQSKIEEGEVKVAWEIEKNFKHKLLLPMDVVVANPSLDSRSVRVVGPQEVAKDEMILDAGPKTILAYSNEIKKAKTIVWSGPLGLYEKKPFHHATFSLARLIGGRGRGKAFVVAGGGDTVDVIRQTHQLEHIDHVSTGGGAMLEYLSGKKLPGIEVLK